MTLSLYRKKPVIIEAIQWTGDNFHHIADIFGLNKIELTTMNCILIPTLEGNMFAKVTDWIIRGIKGEIYPCRNDIFRSTYDKVDDGTI